MPLLNIHNITNRYRRKVSLYNERVEELNNVTQQRDNIKKQYDEWRKKRHAYPSLFLFPIVFFTILCSFVSFYSTASGVIAGWMSSWQASMQYL
jgi:hypothetical protein